MEIFKKKCRTIFVLKVDHRLKWLGPILEIWNIFWNTYIVSTTQFSECILSIHLQNSVFSIPVSIFCWISQAFVENLFGVKFGYSTCVYSISRVIILNWNTISPRWLQTNANLFVFSHFDLQIFENLWKLLIREQKRKSKSQYLFY